MREDLIERLRGSLYACNAIRGYLDEAGFPDDGDAHGQLSEVEATLTEAADTLEWLLTDKQVQHLLASLGYVEPAIHVACQSGAVIREEGE